MVRIRTIFMWGDKMNNRDTMSRLNAALSKIDYAYALIAKKHGLSFNALMMVCLIEESESVTQKQLCDALHLPKSTVHSILLDFIAQDYVVLSPGNNKKEKFVRFTPAGAEAFRVILTEMERFEDNILAALGDETCASLVKTAESLGEIITKELGE